MGGIAAVTGSEPIPARQNGPIWAILARQFTETAALLPGCLDARLVERSAWAVSTNKFGQTDHKTI